MKTKASRFFSFPILVSAMAMLTLGLIVLLPSNASAAMLQPTTPNVSIHGTHEARCNVHGIGEGLTRVEAEDYACGGEGIGFHDTTPENKAKGCKDYRPDDDPDIGSTTDDGQKSCALRHGVGENQKDGPEWTIYNINPEEDLTCDITGRVASADTKGRISLEIDGEAIEGHLQVTELGGERQWHHWHDSTLKDINISAESELLKVTRLDGRTDMNYIEFNCRVAEEPEPEEPESIECVVALRVLYDHDASKLTYSYFVNGPGDVRFDARLAGEQFSVNKQVSDQTLVLVSVEFGNHGDADFRIIFEPEEGDSCRTPVVTVDTGEPEEPVEPGDSVDNLEDALLED